MKKLLLFFFFVSPKKKRSGTRNVTGKDKIVLLLLLSPILRSLENSSAQWSSSSCSTSLLPPTGYTEADVHGSRPTRHYQQRPVHGAHHLHHHAGEQRTFVSHHQLPGARLGRRQHQRQRYRPQDRRRLHRGHAAAQRLHLHARYVGEQLWCASSFFSSWFVCLSQPHPLE